MKPLPAAPLTEEDDRSWYSLMCRNHSRCFGLRSFSKVADRRDAELMRWLSVFGHRHYARMPKMPKSAQLPVAHLWLRIDSEWPLGHYMIDLA